jgi:RNA polymerase-binding transcription factor DksA
MATAKQAPAKPASKSAAPAKAAAPAASAGGKSSAKAAKSAPAKAAPAAKSAPAKAAPAAKSAPAKAAPAAKATPAAKAAPAKAAPTAKSAPATKSAPAKAAPGKAAAAKSAPEVKAPVEKAPTTKAAEPAKVTAPTESPKAFEKKAPRKPYAPPVVEQHAVKGVTKDGISYTKDFDAKFLATMRTLLMEERISLVGQAGRLEDEANAIIEEQEMGDVQFDDEGGEGDTMVVERSRDLVLSAQARHTVMEIDAALERIGLGTYGYSIESGRPIPRERLEAIPWATMLVEEKVGGIGRR